jgi:hypothetical protein
MENGTSLNVTAYVIYLVISIALTVWVARTLFKNGRVFLVDVFQGNEPLADSVNHLLVVGFYLINLGYICCELTLDQNLSNARSAMEALSVKVGTVLIVLGVMHFFNLVIFSRLRRRSLKERLARVVLPDTHVVGTVQPASANVAQ